MPDEPLRDVKCLLDIKEEWPSTAFDVHETQEAVSIDTGAIRLQAQKNPWKYTVYDKAGEVVLKENVRDVAGLTNYRSLPIGFTSQDGKFLRSNETFNLFPGEGFYGFGEKFTRFNKVGQRIIGWNVSPPGAGSEEAYKNIPFFISTRGYGIFVNTTFRVVYEMGSRSLMSYTIAVDDPRLDIFVIYGPRIKDLLARYAEITGWPSLPPKESFGIEANPCIRPPTLNGVVAIAEKYRELDIPVDFFSHQEHMTQRILRPNYSTDEQLDWIRTESRELARFGIRIGLYVAPMLNVGTELEREARDKGYALTREDGSVYEVLLGEKPRNAQSRETECSLAMIERDEAWKERQRKNRRAPCLLPDFTNPEAVRWWKDTIVRFMKAGCFYICMSDYGEEVPVDACYHNGRSGREMRNLYQLLYQKASFEAVAEGTEHRGLVNARSGTAGMQRYPICWSGDSNCSWEDMLNTLRAGLTIGLSGVPFWSCDTGGFFGSSETLTPELWMRWSQWSMFISHPRLHGVGVSRLPWAFGERAVENFRKYARLRYRLLPYIYSQAYKSTKTGLPMIRAMELEYQDDPNTHSMEDQYLFGDAFLVAPVYTSANRRTVYLPEGKWFDYWTGTEHEGPTTLNVQPSLEVIPLYVKDDSIIPMGPDMRYAGDLPSNPLTLDTWLSTEAECTVYDDDEMVQCRARRNEDGVAVDLSASTKTYVMKLNRTGTPTSVKLNGVELPRVDTAEELEASEQGWSFDPAHVVYARFKGLGSSCELVLRV